MVQSLTVLILDDSPEERMVYRRYLSQDQEYKYTILEEESGAGALELCQKFPIDGILLDYMLPDADGLEFLSELKQQSKTRIPAVVMLTGYGNEAIAVQAMKSGVQDYLVKGETTANLLCSTLHSAIKNRQLSEQIRHSEERYHYLLDAVPQIIWITDAQGEYQLINRQWYEFTGQAIEQAMGTGWTKCVHPEDAPSVIQQWLAAVEKGELYEQELRYQRYDGIYHWYLSRGIPIKDQQGKIVQWYGTSTDIECKKQLEIGRIQLLETAQAARTEAEAANQSKDHFVAMVSHDLRTPLNSILGWSQLLRRRNMDTNSTNKALESIQRNALSQAKLIDDLLDISRILQGNLQLEISQVNLISVLKVAIDTAYPSANEKNINLESVIIGNIPPIFSDTNRLQQVIGNLLTNAIKFTPSGGQIQVCLSRLPHYIQITVSDTGIGIQPEFLPYVFERYHQGDSSHRQAGLGLGLTIARHLIELHGGTIEVTSLGVDQGTTFTIKLPCDPEHGST